MSTFDFDLPPDASPDMVAIAELGAGLQQLTDAVDVLHQQHLELRAAVTTRAAAGGGPRKAPAGMPWPVRWRDLDRDNAAQAWAWLIDWVGWLVDRYEIAEEIPACWHRHGPLVEELTALAAGWHTAYDDQARGDEPLIWHERLARARDRLRGWDDFTRCRNGQHTGHTLDLRWPDAWTDAATESANADLVTRPTTASATPAGEEAP
ncbi:hypothetical protein ACTOB_003666 [Actinoplanes oblitus]|uniref:DUF4913 domain-containing protein n=1 Tax=Actinoplanes oblitus TaxID=3040509 RepID=A0ABY8WRB6_9ACTN|nr:hypothetical protein [Actinoplanes oblitus]WIM99992.1 hypothetical protein ACTOB_003666 [Actinoplanes oblitus]